MTFKPRTQEGFPPSCHLSSYLILKPVQPPRGLLRFIGPLLGLALGICHLPPGLVLVILQLGLELLQSLLRVIPHLLQLGCTEQNVFRTQFFSGSKLSRLSQSFLPAEAALCCSVLGLGLFVQLLALPLTSYVTRGKLLILSGSQFPSVKWNNNSTYITRLLGELY